MRDLTCCRSVDSPCSIDEMSSVGGFTIWLTGLPCAGKSTLAQSLARVLLHQGERVEVLDGDVIRQHLSLGLGFNREDRDRNIRQIAFVANLLARNGVVVIVAAVSPYSATRAQARATLGSFVEVHVDCPARECERRDVKGMYKRARAGEIAHFTGVDDPYEPPDAPEVVLRTDLESIAECTERVLSALESLGHAAREKSGSIPIAPVVSITRAVG